MAVDPGVYNITVRVNNSVGSTDSGSFSWTVLASGPTWIKDIPTQTVSPGYTLNINDGTYLDSDTPLSNWTLTHG